MNTQSNPLKQFYRVVKSTVKLPSRGMYYTNGEVEFNEDGEVGILPMTASDEITLKNPDALLTGEAIVDVITSCVPAVKKPKKLLSCDIETLLVGIRDASYGDDLSMEIKCPSCGHENTYSLHIDALLNQADELQDRYSVDLSPTLEVHVKPGTFEATIRHQRILVNNKRLNRLISQDTTSEEQRNTLINSIFSSLSKLQYELILDGISKIVFTDDEGEEHEVVEKKFIDEYIRNITAKEINLIEDQLKIANSVGIAKTIPAICTSCSHSWDAPVEFNPVNFS